jgi:hypothetical protein
MSQTEVAELEQFVPVVAQVMLFCLLAGFIVMMIQVALVLQFLHQLLYQLLEMLLL